MKIAEKPEAPVPNPASETGFGPVLQNRQFLTLWSGQVFSQLADKVYLILAIALVTRYFQQPDQEISGWVSAIMIAFTLPAIFFGSLAGVFVDRWPKKSVLVGTNLLRGVLVWLLPVAILSAGERQLFAGVPLGFALLLGMVFLVSTLTQFFAPAEQAVIPLVVRRDRLLAANSLYTTTMMASVIVGFAIGEPLLEFARVLGERLGVASGFAQEAVVGGAYAIAGLLLLLLQTRENSTPAPEKAVTGSVWADIREGARFLQQEPRVRAALVQLIALFCIFAALAVLAVRLAEVIPALEAEQFGFILSAGGVGMAAGAALLGNWGQRIPTARLSLVGSLGMAAALTGLASATQQLWLALVMTALLGLFAACIGIPMQTIIQSETPESMRGKVFGLQNNATNIALSLPLVLASVAEEWFGLSAVLLGLAGIAAAVSLLTRSIAKVPSQP